MMPASPLPSDEGERLAALSELGVLDSPPDAEFDALVRAAALACGMPIAVIGLIDGQREWIKASVGLAAVAEVPREISFCAHTILGDDLLEVADASRDARFADNPAVTAPSGIRFYAGVALSIGSGHRIGALCVADRQPGRLSANQREALHCLAVCVAQALASWRARKSLHQAVRDRQASEERIQRRYEATPAMLHSIDPQGRLISVSDTWLDRLGYERDEVLGRLSTDFLRPDLREHARKVLLPQLLETGRSYIEAQIVAKSGELVDVVGSAVIERDADGKPLNSLSALQDVTLQRRAERELAGERQRLLNVIEATEAGTWEWNIQTHEYRISERWAAILGYTRAELSPMTSELRFELMHPDDVARGRDAMRRHIEGLTSRYECEFRLRHRDGHFVWIQSRGSVMSRLPDGQPQWALGTMMDVTERRQREEALRKGEEFLERAGEIAGVGAWELDFVTDEVTWSPQTCRIHGLPVNHRPTLAEAITFYPAEYRPIVREAVERGRRSGEGWSLETPLVRADGSRIWARSIGLITVVGGKPVRATGAIQDISEQVAVREALQDARDRVTLATDSGEIGIWHWDVANDHATWDRWMFRLYGMDPDTSTASYALWRASLHPEDRDAAESLLGDCVEHDRPFNTEFRVIWPDGSVHHLRASARLVSDAAGRPLRVVGANWDVTISRRLASDLMRQIELQAEAAERERALFRNSPDVLFIVGVRDGADGHDFVYESMSPSVTALLGVPPEHLVGRRPEECLTPEIAADALQRYRACLATCDTHSYGATLTTPRGARDIEGTIIPICHPGSGQITRLIGTTRDVTERNRMQAELQHGQKMKAVGRLASGVAHDFNNILQSIYGCLELVRDEVPAGTKGHEFLAVGMRAAKRGSSLTHQMLSYARKQMLHPKNIVLPALLSDLRALLGRTLGPHIALTIACDEAVAGVRADPGQLQTALINLAINASQAMPDGGTLTIEARDVIEEGAHWIAIIVTDTGVGMDEATLAQAVEPFFTTKGLNGTGLGLSMVQGFTEQSGGRFHIVSRPGGGTRVEIHLLADRADDPRPGNEADRRPVPSSLLLLVDDDPDVLLTLGAFLERSGFRVARADSAQQALALLQGGLVPDALVSDYAMPGMSGADLLREARRAIARLPALIISGFAEVAEAESMGERTIALHKPFHRGQLLAALATLLVGERSAQCATAIAVAH